MAKNENEMTLDMQLAEEAKAIVAMALRNGPIEDVHAGMECPTCSGKLEYSHITQDEMKHIMKRAVDKVYALLWTRTHCPEVYPHIVKAGTRFTSLWDMPERRRQEIEQLARLADLLTPQQESVKGAPALQGKSKPRPTGGKKQ